MDQMLHPKSISKVNLEKALSLRTQAATGKERLELNTVDHDEYEICRGGRKCSSSFFCLTNATFSEGT